VRDVNAGRDVIINLQVGPGEERLVAKLDAHSRALDGVERMQSDIRDIQAMLTAMAVRRELPFSDAINIKLAQRVKADVVGFEERVAELNHVVDVAVRAEQDGEVSSNLGPAVDEILKERARLTGAGEYEEAARILGAALDDSRSQFDQFQAVHVRLLDAAIESDRLTGDAEGMAQKLFEKSRFEFVDHKERVVWLIERIRDFNRTGHSRGRLIDLRLAARLAALTLPLIVDWLQRFTCAQNEAVALALLGSMTEDEAIMRAALGAYDRAIAQLGELSELRQRRARLEAGALQAPQSANGAEVARHFIQWMNDYLSVNRWAIACNGIAEVLIELGALRKDPGEIEQALTYLSDAHAMFSRGDEEARSRQRTVLLTRGNALATLANLTGEAGHLRAAAAAYACVLRMSRQANDRHTIYLAANNLGNMLWKLDEKSGSSRRSPRAVVYLRQALSVKSRDDEPLEWSKTKYNLAAATAYLGWATRNRLILKDSIGQLEEARDVMMQLDHAGLTRIMGDTLHLVRRQLRDLG
jgi:hypothetical protein